MRLVASRLFYKMCGLAAVAVLLDQVSKLLVFRVLMRHGAGVSWSCRSSAW